MGPQKFIVSMLQDRSDFSAAACQLATRMQELTDHDWERLQRLRNVKCCPRCVLCDPWPQEENTNVKLCQDPCTVEEYCRSASAWFNIGADGNLR